MATDDTGNDDASGWLVPQDGEQPQDALPGQPIARTYQMTCCLICGIVSAALGAAQFAGHSLNFGLVLLGMLAGAVAVVVGPALSGKQLGAISRGICWAAAIFGIIGVITAASAMGVYAG